MVSSSLQCMIAHMLNLKTWAQQLGHTKTALNSCQKQSDIPVRFKMVFVSCRLSSSLVPFVLRQRRCGFTHLRSGSSNRMLS